MSAFHGCDDSLTIQEVRAFFDALYQSNDDAAKTCGLCHGGLACRHCDGGTVFSDQDTDNLDDGEACERCHGSGDCASCDGLGVVYPDVHDTHPADPFTLRAIQAELTQSRGLT